MARKWPVWDPFLTPKPPPKKFMWVPLLRSFPGNEAHKLFSEGPRWGVLGGGQKAYVEKVHVLFPSLIRVMDVRAENGGRPHRKVRFPATPVMGRHFLTPGYPCEGSGMSWTGKFMFMLFLPPDFHPTKDLQNLFATPPPPPPYICKPECLGEGSKIGKS